MSQRLRTSEPSLHDEAPRDLWVWNGHGFRRASPPAILVDDLFPEIKYAEKHLVPLLPNGAGPYCEFVVADLPHTSGVYAIFIDGDLKYVGRARNLKKRFYDYGHFAPRKCYKGGQSTNVLMNKRVRDALRSGRDVHVFARETPDYVALEAAMIAALQPPWNVQGVMKAASPSR